MFKLLNRAKTFYHSLSDKIKRNYPDLKAALIRNFDTAVLQYDRESNSFDCKQRGRDLNTYITELERLGEKLRVDSRELLKEN